MLSRFSRLSVFSLAFGVFLGKPVVSSAQDLDQSAAQAWRTRCSTSPEEFRKWLVSLQDSSHNTVVINDVIVRYRMIVVMNVRAQSMEGAIDTTIHELGSSCKAVQLPVMVDSGTLRIATGDLVVQFAPSAGNEAILEILKRSSLAIISPPTQNIPNRYWVRDQDDDVPRLLASVASLKKNRLVVFAEADTLEVSKNRPIRPY